MHCQVSLLINKRATWDAFYLVSVFQINEFKDFYDLLAVTVAMIYRGPRIPIH